MMKSLKKYKPDLRVIVGYPKTEDWFNDNRVDIKKRNKYNFICFHWVLS